MVSKNGEKVFAHTEEFAKNSFVGITSSTTDKKIKTS